MTRSEIIELDGEIITSEQWDEIAEHEDVMEMENNGNSGRYNGKVWYSVKLTEDEEVSVYL